MRLISLSRGRAVAIVDDCDGDRIASFFWRVVRQGNRSYAIRTAKVDAKWRTVYMHRDIMAAQDGTLVDHRNRDGLDNRRDNLRLCSQSQNNRNKARPNRGSSPYRGVFLRRDRHTWRASLSVDGKKRHLGKFETPESAARAWDAAAREAFGEFAELNFPIGEA